MKNIFEHWQEQREPLRQALLLQNDMNGAVYQMRRAISQTEQNALAEMENDVLRQQASILLGCVKSSLIFCDVNVVQQTSVAQKVEPKTFRSQPKLHYALGLVLLLMIVLALFLYNWLMLALAVIALGISLYEWLFKKPSQGALQLPKDTVSVTVKPDVDKIMTELDRQMRMVERSLNDFSYLNEQNNSGKEKVGEASVAKASELMGALMEAPWEDDEENRSSAEDAAEKLLNQLGLSILRYSPQNRAYFNILPGKQMTKTLTPALLSAEDGHLLKRGTAVVCEKAAG